jgi:hypothetical protein
MKSPPFSTNGNEKLSTLWHNWCKYYEMGKKSPQILGDVTRKCYL